MSWADELKPGDVVAVVGFDAVRPQDKTLAVVLRRTKTKISISAGTRGVVAEYRLSKLTRIDCSKWDRSFLAEATPDVRKEIEDQQRKDWLVYWMRSKAVSYSLAELEAAYAAICGIEGMK